MKTLFFILIMTVLSSSAFAVDEVAYGQDEIDRKDGKRVYYSACYTIVDPGVSATAGFGIASEERAQIAQGLAYNNGIDEILEVSQVSCMITNIKSAGNEGYEGYSVRVVGRRQ